MSLRTEGWQSPFWIAAVRYVVWRMTVAPSLMNPIHHARSMRHSTDPDVGPSGLQPARGYWNRRSGRLLLLGPGHTRRHKCRRHGVDDEALEDGIDVVFGRGVNMPAFDITDWVKLTRVPSTPEGDRWALIEHPAHRKRQYRFAKAFSC